jgi:hypothetical protein
MKESKEDDLGCRQRIIDITNTPESEATYTEEPKFHMGKFPKESGRKDVAKKSMSISSDAVSDTS